MSDQKMLANATKTAEGVSVNGMVVLPIAEQCVGCDRIRVFEEQNFCGSYPNPERKWAAGRCNFATHVKAEVSKAAKVNPLKASKRSTKGH